MKNDRLFQMMNILIEKGFVTAKDLSERFGVSVRTIYRDIEVLSVSGVPLYTIQGKGGGIALMEGYSIDKTMLSDIEQKRVLMALESVQVLTGTTEDASLEKLKNVFHKEDTESWIEIDLSSWENTSSEKEIFSKIKESILQKQMLKMMYHNSNGETTQRIVKPHKLIYKSTSWYLEAYCMLRKANRFFKVRRITDLTILDESIAQSYINQSEHNDQPDKRFEQSVPDKEFEMIEITCEIAKSMAFRVMDEFRNGLIQEQKDSYLVTMNMPDQPWVYNYLLGYGDTLQVLEPERVKQELIKQIKKMGAFYHETIEHM